MSIVTMQDIQSRREAYMNTGDGIEDRSTRDRIMSHAHDAYYCWLADTIGVTVSRLPFELSEVRDALKTDRHLNNLRLQQWDNQDFVVRSMARSSVSGVFSWSLSDTVCVLKAFARREALKTTDALAR